MLTNEELLASHEVMALNAELGLTMEQIKKFSDTVIKIYRDKQEKISGSKENVEAILRITLKSKTNG